MARISDERAPKHKPRACEETKPGIRERLAAWIAPAVVSPVTTSTAAVKEPPVKKPPLRITAAMLAKFGPSATTRQHVPGMLNQISPRSSEGTEIGRSLEQRFPQSRE